MFIIIIIIWFLSLFVFKYTYGGDRIHSIYMRIFLHMSGLILRLPRRLKITICPFSLLPHRSNYFYYTHIKYSKNLCAHFSMSKIHHVIATHKYNCKVFLCHIRPNTIQTIYLQTHTNENIKLQLYVLCMLIITNIVVIIDCSGVNNYKKYDE